MIAPNGLWCAGALAFRFRPPEAFAILSGDGANSARSMNSPGPMRFSQGFVVTFLVFVAINWISYFVRSTSFDAFRMTGDFVTLLSPSSINDGLERVGFPFCFWEAGGFSGGSYFNRLAFLANVAIAITASGTTGFCAFRMACRNKINPPEV